MKKMMIFVLAALLLCPFVSCKSNASDQGTQGALVVGGQTVSTHAIIYAGYATLPLCDVISALGFDLSPDGTDRMSFRCNNVKYEICLSEKTLTKEGLDENYLIPAPGGGHYVCDVSDGDLVLDSGTLHSLFRTFLNYPIEITVDEEHDRVIVNPHP